MILKIKNLLTNVYKCLYQKNNGEPRPKGRGL